MRTTGHDRRFLTRCTYTTLASFLVWSVAATLPPTAQAAELPLGLATGSKEAQMAADGKQWATLPASSNPIYEGTMIRTGKGTASVLLKDSTQLELQPRTLVGLSGSRTAPVVKIARGQVVFRTPSSSRATFVTPSVRYQTDNGNSSDRPTILKAKSSTLLAGDSIGTIVVNPRGASRLSLQQGEMLAKSRSDSGLHIVKAGQSVSIPQVGALDAGFDVMLAQAFPEDAADETNPTAPGDAGTEVGGTLGTGTGAGMGVGTAVGLGVGLAAIGAGIGLGVSESGGNNGPASPSSPSE